MGCGDVVVRVSYSVRDVVTYRLEYPTLCGDVVVRVSDSIWDVVT